jgi:DNA repair exonuclease SbcCD nuclease subunit
LGYRQYNLTQRENDFFHSFEDAIRRYALPNEPQGPPQVDFVVIAGDLFDSRQLEPVTLSRATTALSALREHQIPVFAIEGNHDARKRDQSPCWYDFLCEQELMIFLRDTYEQEAVRLQPWNPHTKQGGYFDLGEHVRIIGSHWYGASSSKVIRPFAKAIAALPPKSFNLLMFHGGLSDYVNDLSGGVDYDVMLQLRPHVQYLALGHIHKQYSAGNWLFNPGSLEVSKSREYEEPHGAYLGEIRFPDASLHVTHRTDYLKRPFVRLLLDCEPYPDPEALGQAILRLVDETGTAKIQEEQLSWPTDTAFPRPVFHLYLTGKITFPFSSLPLQELEKQITETYDLAYLRFSNDTQPVEYQPEEEYPRDENGHIDRIALEQRIFRELIEQDTRYSEQSVSLARFAVDLKDTLLRDALQDHEQSALLQKLQALLTSSDTTSHD